MSSKSYFYLLIILFFLVSAPEIFATVCGNNQCEEGENSCTCSEDCGSCSGEVSYKACSEFYCTDDRICAIQTIANCCKNNICENSDTYNEDYGNCPADCEPRTVNLEIISPIENYKARYGEDLLYKVIADADGRSISGIKINVNGPFEKFTLFNDGLHEDEKFGDNVFGAYNSIVKGTKTGIWDINFSTAFRNIEGNFGIQIEVFPIVDVELIFPSELELGNNLLIKGKFSINNKPVSVGVNAILKDDLNNIIFQKFSESSPEGEFSFNYRTTFIDPVGTWIFSLKGEDVFGNIINEEKRITIFQPGGTPKREITLLKQLKENYSGDDLIELAISVKEESDYVAGATAIANLFSTTTKLTEIGFGEYIGTIKIPRGKIGDNSELIINIFNTEGGLIASKKYLVNISPEKLIVEIISPEKKLFEAGDNITFRALATYSDFSVLNNAKAFAVFNNKKLELKEESPGVFSASYKIKKEDQGQLEIIITVESSEGTTESTSKSVFVSGKSFFYGIEENASSLIIGAIILIIVGTFIATQLKTKASKTGKINKLKEIDELEKQAQIMYLRNKTINKKEYNNLMEKYNKQRRELEI